MWPLLACVLLVACGRVGFAALDDGGATGPWTNLTEVTELNIATMNDDPTLTPDQLEIYFNSMGDIFVATRASAADPWGAPQLVTQISTTASETTPEISADGLELFFSRTNPTNGDVFRSTRMTRGDPWSTPVIVSELNTINSDVGVSLTPDALTMYLSTGTSTNGLELVLSSRSAVGATWSMPMLIPELSSSAFDSDPFITANGLELLWSSGRGASKTDIWRATRSSSFEAWGNLAAVTELNQSTTDEDDPWISPDGHTLYFTRGTTQNVDMRIYMATR